ncbi:unnamed protein product, partial [Musa acuminata var. zebrina]
TCLEWQGYQEALSNLHPEVWSKEKRMNVLIAEMVQYTVNRMSRHHQLTTIQRTHRALVEKGVHRQHLPKVHLDLQLRKLQSLSVNIQLLIASVLKYNDIFGDIQYLPLLQDIHTLLK